MRKERGLVPPFFFTADKGRTALRELPRRALAFLF
jgi:hypothetical protein